jgi:redox-sensitive bicupin YhaK (pirin superfamily)
VAGEESIVAETMATTDATPDVVHLTPDDYHVIRPEDFGSPGLWARESIGPLVPVEALGELVTVHDSRFDPGKGIGHHPHRGMERLFYILEGGVDHDDALNRITGHMGTGDLGILTEGRRGMIHSERNHHDDVATRAYIFVYPTDPTPPVASFDAIRDGACPRIDAAPGVVTKQIIADGDDRLHGDLRHLADHVADAAASFAIDLDAWEAGLIFVVDGEIAVRDPDDGWKVDGVARDHTVLLAPVDRARGVRITAQEPSRVLHAVTGRGLGLRRR